MKCLFFLLVVGFGSFTILAQQEKSNAQLTALELVQHRELFSQNIPAPIGLISDFDSLFNVSQVRELRQLVSDFYHYSGIQIAMVTIDSTDVAEADFEDFTLRLANTWGIGDSILNNGIVIAICKGHRRIRIQNGLGTESILSDKETHDLIQLYFIPAFKEGNYFKGSHLGIQQMIEVILQNSIPKKPADVPDAAFWKGGIDGGYWFDILHLNADQRTLNIAIYDDYYGDLQVQKEFKLHCSTNIDLLRIAEFIDFYSSPKIYLIEKDNTQCSCYLE